MTTLNKYAKDSFKNLTVNSCTDITGFSLIGHSYEMASGSDKTINIFTESLPILNDALEYARMGIIPEGMYNNLEYLQNLFTCSNNISQEMKDILLDPQTSGGLLLSMPEKDALEYMSRIELYNPWTRIIGEVTDKKDYSIIIK